MVSSQYRTASSVNTLRAERTPNWAVLNGSDPSTIRISAPEGLLFQPATRWITSAIEEKPATRSG
ncbi:MAG TPA: hypothetical protein VFC03_07820 [Acidimicrobiales bacterium]|nr:hypothetical protein [Acidimicrobiales bacterium]